MKNRRLKWQAAAIAASGIVTVGALAAAVTGQEQKATAAVGVMSVGQTTTSTAPGGPITVAKPGLKAKKPKGF